MTSIREAAKCYCRASKLCEWFATGVPPPRLPPQESTIALAQEILSRCHPDAVTVIRHWVTIIQSRWEEVSLWARQREQKLAEHLRSLRDVLELLEELLRWLMAAEASLMTLEAQPLPQEVAATGTGCHRPCSGVGGLGGEDAIWEDIQGSTYLP